MVSVISVRKFGKQGSGATGGCAMRELPFDIDADALIEVGRYLDDHAKSTAVSNLKRSV